ncbi:hypothetical protein L1987_50225 [Smallanthus sonchifolius]|uniref:Uncharacterized protein n=1 Tax=Smallanthus sonchifolius TaxID=185202 RepID=A0ACB9FWQ7_9ASTR|nr:hypothetical protein L1987_50225 [Smallanthus sonchifolius]
MPCIMRIRSLNLSKIIRESIKMEGVGLGWVHKYLSVGSWGRVGTLLTQNTLLWSDVRNCSTYGSFYGKGGMGWANSLFTNFCRGLAQGKFVSRPVTGKASCETIKWVDNGDSRAHVFERETLLMLVVIYGYGRAAVSLAAWRWFYGVWVRFWLCTSATIKKSDVTGEERVPVVVVFTPKSIYSMETANKEKFEESRSMDPPDLGVGGKFWETDESSDGSGEDKDQNQRPRVTSRKNCTRMGKPSSFLDGTRESALRRYSLRSDAGGSTMESQNQRTKGLKAAKKDQRLHAANRSS